MQDEKSTPKGGNIISTTWDRTKWEQGRKSRLSKYLELVEIAKDPAFIAAADKCKPEINHQQAVAGITESWRGRK